MVPGEPRDGDDGRAAGADRRRGRSDPAWGTPRQPSSVGGPRPRSPHADGPSDRDPRGRADALGVHVLAPDDRGQGLPWRRIRPARAPLRTPTASGARLLRPPADGAADVAGHCRPGRRALLPRLRPGLHPAVDPDDRAGGDRDGRDQPGPRPDLVGAGAVRGRDLLPLRPPSPPCDPGDPAAHRRARPRTRRRTSPVCAS